MKRTLFFILLSLLCTIGSHAQKAVVWEKPNALSFHTGGGSEFNVTKMELKKNETVMHLNVRFRPHNWIKFVKTSVLKAEDGKEYAIISGEPTAENESRMEPDSLFWMPESGEANLALHFKPLPQNTKKADFIEGYEEGAFRIWNICEAKNTPSLPEEWHNIKYADNEKLPEAKLKKGVATIKVRMMDYKPGMDVTLTVTGMEPLIEKDFLQMEVKMDDNGCAVAEVPLHLTRQVTVMLDNAYSAQCLIAPGETTECLINPYMKQEDMYTFRGYMARTNMDLNKVRIEFNRSYDDGKPLYEALKKCTTPEERFNAIDDIFLKKIKNEVDQNPNLCDAAKALTRMEIEGRFFSWLFNFPMEYSDMLIAAGEEKSARTREEINVLIDKYKELMPQQAFKDKVTSMSFETFTAPYAPCSEIFWHYYALHTKKDTADVKLSMLESLYGVKMIVKGYAQNESYDYYVKHFADSSYMAAIDDYYAKQECIKQELKTHDNIFYGTLDSVAPENILNTILDKYKGKAVLIDVWQTWCGPCRMGHKMLAPVKEELKDKNIAFVYISSPSSPIASWQQMVTEIPGDHYYLTRDQFNYVMDNIMNSKGVPTYAIYDTDGKQTYKMIGFPGADAIKAELEKVIK